MWECSTPCINKLEEHKLPSFEWRIHKIDLMNYTKNKSWQVFFNRAQNVWVVLTIILLFLTISVSICKIGEENCEQINEQRKILSSCFKVRKTPKNTWGLVMEKSYARFWILVRELSRVVKVTNPKSVNKNKACTEAL